ncbi:MAG: DUF3500 domain-containing protein [Gammaproteobacteria bacterium]|nr:DUF3500 domain-containing protein [Gammaproteobacteria bacterium]
MTEHWTRLPVRKGGHMSARTRVEQSPGLSRLLDERLATLPDPIRGITTDGAVRNGLFPLASTGVSTKPITDAAQTFLQALGAEQRARTVHSLDADEWRTWNNIHPNCWRHGIMLEDLPDPTRKLALDLVAASLSARGFEQARDIMRLNGLLAVVSGSPDEFGEWPYFLSIFGEPSDAVPWGWQLDGHHLNINCMVIGDHLLMTPTFMGSEPCDGSDELLPGTSVFVAEERAGLDLIRSFDASQRSRAVTRPSIHPDDLPQELKHPFDGRMVGGTGHDNAVVPYEGVVARDLSDAQRRLLLSLVGTYVGWTRDRHADIKMREVDAHLDETWFSWMGATTDDGPFYYRVHSPVVLIEFDHHPGVVFDNPVPSRNHIHTIVRTPNGGDYGVDLLRQHHERYDHSHGTHEPRRQ